MITSSYTPFSWQICANWSALGAPVKRKQTTTKIGSSKIEMLMYFAATASTGAVKINGKTMRDNTDAIRILVSVRSVPGCFAFVDVEFARFAPRTTRMRGTATCPDCVTARVKEVWMKVPGVKKSLCRAGMEATITAASMDHNGGFMEFQTAREKRFVYFQTGLEMRLTKGGVGRDHLGRLFEEPLLVTRGRPD